MAGAAGAHRNRPVTRPPTPERIVRGRGHPCDEHLLTLPVASTGTKFHATLCTPLAPVTRSYGEACRPYLINRRRRNGSGFLAVQPVPRISADQFVEARSLGGGTSAERIE